MRKSVRLPGIAIPLLSVVLASGCVDLKSEATILENGSGSMVIEYRVPRSLAPLDRYTGDAPGLPFPLEKAEIDRRILAVPGMVLLRWTREDLRDEIHISAEFRFPDIPSLVKFLDPKGKRVTYTQAGGIQELKVALSLGRPPPSDAKTWAEASYASYAVDLSVSVPTPIISAVPGTLSASNRAARYTLPTVDILESPTPIVWTIRW